MTLCVGFFQFEDIFIPLELSEDTCLIPLHFLFCCYVLRNSGVFLMVLFHALESRRGCGRKSIQQESSGGPKVFSLTDHCGQLGQTIPAEHSSSALPSLLFFSV